MESGRMAFSKQITWHEQAEQDLANEPISRRRADGKMSMDETEEGRAGGQGRMAGERKR